jgi:CBS domain-containing protein
MLFWNLHEVMAMKVRELMSSPVLTCQPQDSLERAAQLLWENDCGVLPVVDKEGRLAAAITDRDICMGAYTCGQRLADLRVADSMSKAVVSCGVDDDFAVAARRMTEHRVRRLPVVDDKGRVCGILSLNDLARVAGLDRAVAREAMAVLTAVCSKRAAPRGVTPSPVRELVGPLPTAAERRSRSLESSTTEAEC